MIQLIPMAASDIFTIISQEFETPFWPQLVVIYANFMQINSNIYPPMHSDRVRIH